MLLLLCYEGNTVQSYSAYTVITCSNIIRVRFLVWTWFSSVVVTSRQSFVG